MVTRFAQEAEWLPHYNSHAGEVPQEVNPESRVTASLTQRDFFALIGWVGIGRPSCVLDVGCGNGRLLWLLRQAFSKAVLYGVDFSEGRIKVAGDSVDAYLTCGDLYGTLEHFHTGIRDRFNLITCFEVFEHLVDPSLAASLCRQLLAPGGVMVGTVPIEQKPVRQHLTAFVSKQKVEDMLGVTVLKAPVQFNQPRQVAFAYHAPRA